MNSNRNAKDFKQNNLLARLENLLESSKPTIPRHSSPLNNSKSKIRASSSEFSSLHDKSLYDKYSRIWASKTISKASISYLGLLYKKLCQKWKIHAWKAFLKLIPDPNDSPLAFTLCSKCGTASLTLLTTSTQDNLSPRFISKVKSILPKGTKSSSIPNNSKKNTENFNSTSFKHNQNTSPEQKIPISELSPIIQNSFFLSSLNSPDQIKRPKMGNKNEELSFEVSQESWSANREKLNFPKQVIPKLKLKNALDQTIEGLQKFFSVIEYVLYKKKLATMRKLKEKNDSLPLKYEPNGTFGKKKEMTSGKKTAFKILYSRLEKFVFRRKMQGFYSISELIYR